MLTRLTSATSKSGRARSLPHGRLDLTHEPVQMGDSRV
jgi:hypothetical protein